MNKLTIIGNLTNNPVKRQTQSGIDVCSFTVAVNRRRTQEGQPEADFFRVTAWRGLADNCDKYLAKGRKVAVTGAVSVSTYTAQDGTARASMEITADDVEFLTPKEQGSGDLYQAKKAADAEKAYVAAEREAIQHEKEYVDVTDTEDLPF